jgi:TPR repeat protein
MIFAHLMVLSASAADLPGVAIPFEATWMLGADVPAPLAAAGAAPGWALAAVDDLPLTDPLAVQRAVANGPSRDLRLRFTAGDPPVETVLVVRRAPLVQAEQVDTIALPAGFSGAPSAWLDDGSGTPTLADATGARWSLDLGTGAFVAAGPDAAMTPRLVPELLWGLSAASWVIDRDGALATGDSNWARGTLAGATRVATIGGRTGDHLLMPAGDHVAVLALEFPRGTPVLPSCTPQVPETCLASGREILANLGDRPGARLEALSHLQIGCANGVRRACFEAAAVEDPSLAGAVASCNEDSLPSCLEVARAQLALEPEKPGDAVLSMFDHACELEGTGTLGERLRRVEDVGAACAQLSAAYDLRGLDDRALLALDQACVVGRAESCEQAAGRRKQAFAARTVRECEAEAAPIAPSCVELGRLLQEGQVPTAKHDDFGAFLLGCQLGSGDGCVALADYVDRWGIENPRVAAAESDLRGACKGGEQLACLGTAYLLVRHDPRSDAYGEALLLFDAACDAGLGEACVAGAEQRRIGQARKVDAPTAIEMWSSACTRHDATGCAGLGERLVRERDGLGGAYDAWTQACDLGDPHACSELGHLVAEKHEPAWAGEQPPPAYLSRGCDRGDPIGCFWLAEETLPRSGEPPEPTYVLLERSCGGEYGPGCAALGQVHLDRDTSFDDEIAARHLDTACANGEYESCRDLGTMYLRGQGVERDRAKANELLERFRLNARRHYLRIGIQGGLPSAAGGDLELVLPIPVGPALSVGGGFSQLPGAGGILVVIEGDTNPADPPDLRVLLAGARLYPNHQARGIYGAAGFQQITAFGSGLREDRQRIGWNGAVGIRNDQKVIYTGLELGLGQYGVIDLHDFDEDKTGVFPLIIPTLSLSVGLTPF